jgi:hypothetical protein
MLVRISVKSQLLIVWQKFECLQTQLIFVKFQFPPTVFDIKSLVVTGGALCTKVKNVHALRKKLLCFKPICWLHILRKASKLWLTCTAVYAARQHCNIQRSKLMHIITLGMCLVPMSTIATTTFDPYLYFLKFYTVLQGNMILKRALTFSFPVLSQPLSVINDFCNSTLDDISRQYAPSIYSSYSITPKYVWHVPVRFFGDFLR